MKRSKGGNYQKISHVDSRGNKNQNQQLVDEYNLKRRGNTLNKFSQHLPADKNKQIDTKLFQEIDHKDDGLTTIQQSQFPTSTYLRLDQKIDEQEERRNDLQTSLINKIEELHTELITRGDSLRTELERKIESAKSDNRSHINYILTVIISLLAIICGYIIYSIRDNSKNIEEIKKWQTEVKIKLVNHKEYR